MEKIIPAHSHNLHTVFIIKSYILFRGIHGILVFFMFHFDVVVFNLTAFVALEDLKLNVKHIKNKSSYHNYCYLESFPEMLPEIFGFCP